ncbi:DUF4112 domain-containing protein [Dongia deserti]|uniref:DUF4112 domain-containing protein n=1 Tax=Dongia deserti TaxID=2268030 RepID=UPI000E654D90|nr:DUF4112 domain-containing protein [Dongia deserti]
MRPRIDSTGPTDQRIAALKGREEAQRRLRRLARLMDSQFRVPGLGVRIGADAILGLVPGVGDVLSGAVGAYLIYEAHRLGIPRSALVRMIANVAFDTAVGALPIAGDIWDFFFRSNQRNMQILARHVGGLPIDVPYEDAKRR